jgi:hypothetical protein
MDEIFGSTVIHGSKYRFHLIHFLKLFQYVSESIVVFSIEFL